MDGIGVGAGVGAGWTQSGNPFSHCALFATTSQPAAGCQAEDRQIVGIDLSGTRFAI